MIKSAQKRLARLPDRLALVTGCPRSGTTALVRWLDGNRRVYAISESRALHAVGALAQEARRYKKFNDRQDVIHDTSKYLLRKYYYSTRVMPFPAIIIDKEPLLSAALGEGASPALFIENLRYALPDLKVVVLLRDPISTLWSMTQRKWGHSIEGRAPDFLPLQRHMEVWSESARLALDLYAEGSTYICQFEKLCSAPASESNKIFSFLDIKGSNHFSPRETKTTGFSPNEVEQIRAETDELVRELGSRGIVDVSLWRRA